MGSFQSFVLGLFFKKCPATGKIISVRWRNAVSMILLPITGLLALIWYMVRVLPKPSRASYPCQRVAAPIASTFVTWLIAITISSIAFRKARTAFKRSRYVVAGLCASAAITAIYLCSIKTADPADAQTSGLQPLPAPIGGARGTVPGRVVWAWDPAATNENCTDVSPDLYLLDTNTNSCCRGTDVFQIDTAVDEYNLRLCRMGSHFHLLQCFQTRPGQHRVSDR